jgi:serine protease AprX
MSQWPAKFGKLIGYGAILSGLASLAFAGHPKIAQDLSNVKPDATVDVIVQYTHPPSDDRYRMLSRIGARHKAHLQLINAEAVTLSRRDLDALAEDPDVARISSDQPVFGSLDYAIPATNADLAAKIYGYDGTGIGIAVIDSGIVDIPDLHNSSGYRVRYSQNFAGNGGGSAVDQY